jgi:hypothetical protein|tara:strand:- start:1506 stop:1643 length:138 start_codon:yes stop_codon:yes gene_type:complete
MNNIPPTHKKILTAIGTATKIPLDRILFDALMDYHRKKLNKDFKL